VANPIVGQGGTPQTAHFAFVVNSNPAGNGGTVEIDVSGDTNLQIQPSGAGAVAEAFLAGNTGALFTANSLADSLSYFTTFQTFASVGAICVPPMWLTSRPLRSSIGMCAPSGVRRSIVDSGAAT